MATRNQSFAVACDDALEGQALPYPGLLKDEWLAQSLPSCVLERSNAVIHAVSSSHFLRTASRTTSTQRAFPQYASVSAVPNALPLQRFPGMMGTEHATRSMPTLRLDFLGLKSTLARCGPTTARRTVSACSAGLHPYCSKEAVVVGCLVSNDSKRARFPASRSIAGGAETKQETEEMFPRGERAKRARQDPGRWRLKPRRGVAFWQTAPLAQPDEENHALGESSLGWRQELPMDRARSRMHGRDWLRGCQWLLYPAIHPAFTPDFRLSQPPLVTNKA